MSLIGQNALGRSDSFGQSTGIRVNVSTRPSRFAQLAALVACLFPVPAAPAIGLVLLSIARVKMRGDASLTASASLRVAYWAGAIGTIIQILVLALLIGMAWLSVEAASSAVWTQAVSAGSSDAALTRRADVAPGFSLWEFRPGATLPYTLAGETGPSTVQVTFASAPSWSDDGLVFAAQIEPRPAE